MTSSKLTRLLILASQMCPSHIQEKDHGAFLSLHLVFRSVPEHGQHSFLTACPQVLVKQARQDRWLSKCLSKFGNVC